MEATVIEELGIIYGASIAITVTAGLILTRNKKKPQYSVKNVVWWIDKHISPSMMTKKPKVVDKVYGQYAYLNSPIQDITMKIDKLMKRLKTTKIDDDFLMRLSYVFVAKQYVGKPFLFFGLIRNKYLPKKRVKRTTILPEVDTTEYESFDVMSTLDKEVTQPLTIPPFYFYCKVTDSLSYFILFMNRNAVRLFGNTAAAQA